MNKYLILGTLICLSLSFANLTYADQEYKVHTEDARPTLLETIGNKTEAAAQNVCDKSKKAAKKTADFVVDKSEQAAEKTEDAFQKTGDVIKDNAIKAGRATKRGAKKATNATFRKIKSGAEKVIENTEPDESGVPSELPQQPSEVIQE